MKDEALCLLLIFALGTACASLYDLFRAFHTLIKKYDAAVIISDVVYWIVITQGVIYFLWKINGVAIQLYETAVLLLGTILYFWVLSPYIYRFFSVIVIKTAKIIRYILKILLTPARFLYKIITALVCFIINMPKKKRKASKKREGEKADVGI